MSFLLNERSLHGQFANENDFESALTTIMSIRMAIEREGWSLACSRALSQETVTSNPQRSLRQVVGRLPRDRQRAVMSWLDRQGPLGRAEKSFRR